MILACRDITYRFPEADDFVLRNIHCEIPGSGFHGLFGLSGVGKSTLARILTHEITDYDGVLEKKPGRAVLYSFNTERLPGWSSVGAHIGKVITPERHGQMTELLHIFGLGEVLDARFSRLSLGQKNRANLVRYLLQDFDLLIMDESLANVDESTRELIILTIKDRFPDKSFLYISHSVLEVARFCDTIFVLRDQPKTPQLTTIKGLNHAQDQDLNQDLLGHVMMEIVNVS